LHVLNIYKIAWKEKKKNSTLILTLTFFSLIFMCGIFGYIGKKSNPLTTCINGLKLLEYRGYDSAGIASIKDGEIIFCKEAGRVTTLEKKVASWQDKQLHLAIAHTRWATHGKPNNDNAHPHFDEKKMVALVHNGIIENYATLKSMLQGHGVKFSSDTDTEVIAQLFSYFYKDDPIDALIKTVQELKGSFALAIIHKGHPNSIFALTKESPLAIGYDDEKEETIISSDPNTFLGKNLNIFFLKNEIAIVSAKDIKILDFNKNIISKPVERLESTTTLHEKGSFEHFMLKEIFEQPFTVQKAFLGKIAEEYGTIDFGSLNISSKELSAIDSIQIIACGTSWHAGLLGALYLEHFSRIRTHAEIASEQKYKNPIISENTLVIAISQSGETADTIAALREAKAKGAKILSLCNVKNSTIARESDSCLFLNAGPEISVCSTKAFTSQVTLLFLFSIFMARLRHMSKQEGQYLLEELKKIPNKIKEILQNIDEIEKLAKKYSHFHNFIFLGRRFMYPTCLEAALKLKEISYLNATAYPAGEMKHGPIALISPMLPTIALCNNKQTHEKIISNIMEVKARDGKVLAITSKKSIITVADDVLLIPDTIDELAPILSSIVGQLFAYFIAKEQKTDIDHPRNLAKSVTVE
jgi:glucosamine--fructose-6-phosphate aminotransferase (isomerizing)